MLLLKLRNTKDIFLKMKKEIVKIIPFSPEEYIATLFFKYINSKVKKYGQKFLERKGSCISVITEILQDDILRVKYKNDNLHCLFKQ